MEQKHIEFKYLVKSFDCNEENFELLQKELVRFHFNTMALEEKIEKMKESHEFQLGCLQQQIDLYKRLYENKYESEVEEEDH